MPAQYCRAAVLRVFSDATRTDPGISVRRQSYTGRRGDLLSLVPASARNVLDMGCSNGSFGGALKDNRPCAVTGIELDGEMAAEAREVLDHVVVGDLNNAGVYERLPGEPFDAVVAADVLEHLVDPWSTVRALADKLSDKGVFFAFQYVILAE